jgi:hypothetical protein
VVFGFGFGFAARGGLLFRKGGFAWIVCFFADGFWRGVALGLFFLAAVMVHLIS